MDDKSKEIYFDRPLKNLNWGEIYLTFKCNNFCSFCHSLEKKMPEDPSNKQINAMILKTKKSGVDVINFSGGEPTIHEHFLYFVNLSKNLGFKDINVKTNARTFKDTDFARKSIESGVTQLFISLHAHNEKINDKLCGSSGAFKDTIRGIKNLVSLGFKDRISTITVISRDNYKFLPEIVELVNNMGIKNHSHVFPIISSRVLAIFNDTIATFDDVGDYLHKALDTMKKNKINGLVDNFPLCFLKNYEVWASSIYSFPGCSKNLLKCPHVMKCDYGDMCGGIEDDLIYKRGWDEVSPCLTKKPSCIGTVKSFRISSDLIPVIKDKFMKTNFGGTLSCNYSICALNKKGFELVNEFKDGKTLDYYYKSCGQESLNFIYSLYKRSFINLKGAIKEEFLREKINNCCFYSYEYPFTQKNAEIYEVILET